MIHLELTRLPEWSAFFRSLIANRCLRVRWREAGGQWVAQAYEFSTGLEGSLEEIPQGPEITGTEKFDVLRRALEACSRKINQAAWDAFYAFKAAATGGAGDIEDLL